MKALVLERHINNVSFPIHFLLQTYLFSDQAASEVTWGDVRWRKCSCFDCVISKHSFQIDKAIMKWYFEMNHSCISHSQLLDKERYMHSGWTLIRQLTKGQLLFLMQQETEFKAGFYFLLNSLHNLIVSGWERQWVDNGHGYKSPASELHWRTCQTQDRCFSLFQSFVSCWTAC